MNNDDEIGTVLLNIVRIGILHIRNLGFAGNVEECAIQADHLHNLPQLVKSPRREELLYYYNIERTAFLQRTSSNTDMFKPEWEKLSQMMGLNDAR